MILLLGETDWIFEANTNKKNFLMNVLKRHLEPIGTFGVTNALICTPTHQTIELATEHVFQSPSDRSQKEEKLNKLRNN